MKDTSSCQEIRDRVNEQFNWIGISKKDKQMLDQTRSLLSQLPLYLQAEVCDEEETGE